MLVFICAVIVSTSVTTFKTKFLSATTVPWPLTQTELFANPNWTLFASTTLLVSVEFTQFNWALSPISICHDTLYLTHTWTTPAHYRQYKSQLSWPQLLDPSPQTNINTSSKFIVGSSPRDFQTLTFFQLESKALSRLVLSHNLPKFHVKYAYLFCGSHTSSGVDLISAVTLFDSITNVAYFPHPNSSSFWSQSEYVCLGQF